MIKKKPSGNIPEGYDLMCGMYWNRTSDLMPVKHAL